METQLQQPFNTTIFDLGLQYKPLLKIQLDTTMYSITADTIHLGMVTYRWLITTIITTTTTTLIIAIIQRFMSAVTWKESLQG